MICSCGAKLQPGSRFCGVCGLKITRLEHKWTKSNNETILWDDTGQLNPVSFAGQSIPVELAALPEMPPFLTREHELAVMETLSYGRSQWTRTRRRMSDRSRQWSKEYIVTDQANAELKNTLEELFLDVLRHYTSAMERSLSIVTPRSVRHSLQTIAHTRPSSNDLVAPIDKLYQPLQIDYQSRPDILSMLFSTWPIAFLISISSIGSTSFSVSFALTSVLMSILLAKRQTHSESLRQDFIKDAVKDHMNAIMSDDAWEELEIALRAACLDEFVRLKAAIASYVRENKNVDTISTSRDFQGLIRWRHVITYNEIVLYHLYLFNVELHMARVAPQISQNLKQYAWPRHVLHWRAVELWTEWLIEFSTFWLNRQTFGEIMRFDSVPPEYKSFSAVSLDELYKKTQDTIQHWPDAVQTIELPQLPEQNRIIEMLRGAVSGGPMESVSGAILGRSSNAYWRQVNQISWVFLLSTCFACFFYRPQFVITLMITGLCVLLVLGGFVGFWQRIHDMSKYTQLTIIHRLRSQTRDRCDAFSKALAREFDTMLREQERSDSSGL